MWHDIALLLAWSACRDGQPQNVWCFGSVIPRHMLHAPSQLLLL
jgi:hypothetical protein